MQIIMRFTIKKKVELLRKFHIFSVILLLGFAICLTNGFADDDGILVEDNFDFPTADGAGYIQGNAEYQKIPDKIIGTADFEKMRDLPRASQDYQLGTKVGWIRIPKRNEPGRSWFCTGFLVGPDLFMTNHHCIHDKDGLLSLADARIFMDYYQDDDVDTTRGGVTARVTEIVRMHQYKDYALLRLDTSIGNTYGWLELDTGGNFNSRQSVKMISHPDGRSKEIVRRNSGIVDIPSWHPLAGDRTALAYLADTEGGSSGSPVFLRGGTSVIAIHHTAWWNAGGVPRFNAGTLMSYIEPEIRRWLPPKATTLQKVSGDNQSARINTQLSNPFVIKVLDQNGAVLSGVSVNFSVSPSGTLTSEAETTDSNGLAETRLTLGSTSGAYSVIASVSGIAQPVTFTATATPPPPRATTLEKVSGDNQSGSINSQLANPLVVRVLDQNGAVLSGVSVNFSVSPSGTLTPEADTTDGRGLAEAQLTLGSTLGSYSVTASASGITESVTFTATATEPPRATTLEKVSGDNQSGSINSQLADPLVVRVLDQNGAVLSGVSVNFSVSPSGTLTPEAGTTDSSGLAEAHLTLGSTLGAYSVTASVSGITEPVTFTATATEPPRATTLEKVSGDNQSGSINSQLADPLVVRVLDQNGAVLSGVSVNFSVSPSGTLTPEAGTTDSSGLAEAHLTLGSTLGAYSVTASVSGITEPVTFTATATEPPRATTLEKVSGDNQSARINSQLSNPLVVRVLDQNGAVLPGVSVNFSVDNQSASINAQVRNPLVVRALDQSGAVPSGVPVNISVTTNNHGLAEAQLTLGGDSGQYTVTVSVSGITESVTFTATATEPPPPPRATTLEKVSGDDQSGSINSQLANPLVVRVLDQNGAVLPGVSVNFSVSPSGTLTPEAGTTDGSGLAEVQLTLGSTSGAYSVTASVSGITESVTFTATATPPPPVTRRATTLEKVSGDNQSARINTQLANPLVVRVLDQDGAVLSGTTVQFSVSPSAALTPQTDTTNNSGLAETRLTLGSTSGQYSVTASVSGITESVTFTATATEPPPPPVTRRATTLEKVSGDNQSARINSQLANPLVVRVLDQDGAVLSGIIVNFSVSPSGTLTPPAAATDNSGLAETRLRFGGTSGQYTVTAKAIDIAQPVTFTATATKPPPPITRRATTLQKVSGDNQSARINAQVPNPLVVRVLDQNGAVLSGATVNFSVSPSGTLTPPAAATNNSGLAETRLRFSNTSGQHTITARVSGITEPVRFTATATKPPPPPVTRRATTLQKVSGDNQSARINTRLSNPFVVRVLDQNGAVLSGTTVQFSVSPSATLTSQTDTTNNSGLAETRLTLGSTSGQYSVTVSVSGITEPVTFTATATEPPASPPPRATTLQKVSGDNQSARINTRLSNPFVVRVLDQNGAVLSGTTVQFSVSPSATLTSQTDTTNNSGLAETRLTLGSTSGQYSVTVSVSGITEPVTFTATATEPPASPPPRATTLQKVSGDNQSASINSQLADPLVVRVLDQNGAVLSGISVNFSVSPSGTLTPETDTTNNHGLAETRLILGSTSGQYSVTASVSGIAQPVTFTATATQPPQSLPITFNPSVIDDLTLPVNIAMEPLDMPLAEGGTPPYVYTLDPILTGLFFSEVTRELSGTPTIVETATITYTATDVQGETNSLTFTIEVIEDITQPETPLDVDGDGEITVIDLAIVAMFYGTQVPTGINLPADVNADNVVNVLDLTAVANAIDAAGGLSKLSHDEIKAALLEAAIKAAALKVIAGAPINHTASQHALNVAAALSSTKRFAMDDIRLGKKLETVLSYFLQTFTKMGAIPETTALLPNYPNPFNPETWIPYTLSLPTDVVIEIYAANGSLVRRLNIGHQPAGFYVNKSSAAYWDGRNMIGEPVASGLYFYSLIAGDYAETKKMLIRR